MRPWTAATCLTMCSFAPSAPARADGLEPTEGATGAQPASVEPIETTHLTVPWLLSGRDSAQSPFGTAQTTSGLELHLDHDFMIAGLPLSVQTSGSADPDHAAGEALAKPVPLWQSQLVVRLRANLFVGGAVETSTALPSTVSLVVGKKF